MIKCTYFSKLLKLWLFTLLIGFFGFWVNSFVNAMDLGIVYPIWYTYNSSVINSNIEMWVLPKGAFLSRVLWQAKPVFSPISVRWNDEDQYSTNEMIYLFWNNKKPYLYVYKSVPWYLFFNQGFLTSYKVCDYFGSGGSYPLNCVSSSLLSENDIDLMTSFISTVSSSDYFYYYTNIDWYGSEEPYLQVCISSSELNKSICFEWWCTTYSINSSCQQLTGSLWLSIKLSYADLDVSLLDNPPSINIPSDSNNQVIWWEDIDWFNYVWTDEENLVSYFENNPYYKFDENICYVWTDDFSLYYQYSDNPLFYKWQWDNIFDLYSFLFWNSYNIQDVWRFINARDINYNTWYRWKNRDSDWNVIYNAWYSLSSWFYQDFSDNLTNPFYWERLATYFMALNTSSYWIQSTLWEEIATYCYYKLGSDVNTWYSITDNSNQSYWNNAWQFSQNLRRFKTYFSGSDSIQSQSWEWTPLQYLSWDDDLDFSTFFSKSFNKFKDTFTINPTDLWAWFLPTYIILFLLAIIVFRFISH